jgi:hypothetical protein
MNMPKSLTKLEQEREDKKTIGAIVEEIEAEGQDSDIKAAKFVIEKGREKDKQEEEKEFETRDKLEKRANNTNLYRDSVKNEARRRISEYDIPRGFQIDCVLTTKGLAFGYKYFTDKMWFMKGIKLSGMPIYDLNGVDRMINQALDEIDRRINKREKDHQTAGGIALPNGQSN